MQMAAVAAAVRRYRTTGLAYLVYLRHPTPGGVLASWGALGHVTFAEPGALVGMTGPRVIEQLSGRPLPREALSAEHLRDRGLIDDVVAPDTLAEHVVRVLRASQEPATAPSISAHCPSISPAKWRSTGGRPSSGHAEPTGRGSGSSWRSVPPM
jgi:acetyl-CoA carboxylase carboxyl transferase subunit beta